VGERLSIYASAPVQRVLALVADNRSGRLATVCERYLALVDRYCPRLTIGEWYVVIEAMRMEQNDAWRLVPSVVRDAEKREGLCSEWEIDVEDLAPRLELLEDAGRLAIQEIAERFWARRKPRNLAEADRVLREIGAKIEPGVRASRTA